MGGSRSPPPPNATLNSIPLVIVGAKSDLSAERQVSRDLVSTMATMWGVPYYETSSKRDLNVNAVFVVSATVSIKF